MLQKGVLVLIASAVDDCINIAYPAVSIKGSAAVRMQLSQHVHALQIWTSLLADVIVVPRACAVEDLLCHLSHKACHFNACARAQSIDHQNQVGCAGAYARIMPDVRMARVYSRMSSSERPGTEKP